MFGLAGLAILFLIAFFCWVPTAHAAVITDRPLEFSFDGSDTTAGPFGDQRSLDVDQASGDVYVLDTDGGVLDKFNAAGEAQTFAATGESSLAAPAGEDVAIDNSNVNPGRIYLLSPGWVRAFSPAGSLLWELSVGGGCAGGVAVDQEGRLWVGDHNGQKVRQFANSGSPPSEGPDSFEPDAAPCRLDLDSGGNVYMMREIGGGSYRIDKYVGGVFDSILDPVPSRDVAVDQSSASGHIFTVHGGYSPGFDEYDTTGALIDAFGTGVISNGHGIAYNPNVDRVYVSEFSTHSVYAFGPVITGTVPDVTIEEPTAVGISKTTFNGKVNPQSVPNSYFFEWKRGTATTGWGEAHSAPQPLPEDSAEHPVSFDASGLKGDREYQVRLVGLNTANGLRAVSNSATFKTAKAASPPDVTIGEPTSVTTTTAQLHGTVDPQQDFGTQYRFQTSTDPACKAGTFTDRPLRDLESETSSAVSEEITGLLPGQHYCVRITATNSAGTTASESKEFMTKAIPPSEASTAFAAPRLDTSARINARVNPEGDATLTYRFEWSEDGANWTELPLRESTAGARHQIVIADELTGLEPDTTYHYRLALVENEAGQASVPAEAKTFTTRTTSEVRPPTPCPNETLRVAQGTDSYLGACRAIELVSPPDKGTQNVRAEIIQGTSPLSADGERAVWNVLAGAPGGNVGAGPAFLAERTPPGWDPEEDPSGWHSRAVLAPAAQQAGSREEGRYSLATTTPELSAFVFNAGVSALAVGDASERLVWVDASQNQRTLAKYPQLVKGARVDMTDDGAHVLVVNTGGLHQLEDLGGPAPQTVSLMPDGVLSECGLDSSDTNRSFVGGGNSPQAAALLWRPGYHMIATTDASRVYFQAKPNGKACGPSLYGIYVRNRESGETTLIDPGTGSSPNFIRTAPDGRTAYFLTFSSCRKFKYPELTCEIPELEDANSNADVYRWDEEAGESTCLTCVVPDAEVALNTGGVLVSDDFSHVYFQSKKQLVPGQGKAGELNLYSLSGGAIDFVANPNDGARLSQNNALLSADGEVLVFVTANSPSAHQDLTADHLAAKCAQLKQTTPQPCEELVRYDDRDDSLECLSCRHGAITENSVGVAEAPPGHDFKIAADGSTVAFTTAEPLVPLDVNRSTDVYEWRNGVQSLLSDGVTTYPQSNTASPQLHAVGADGADILFSLVDPTLTGFEQDGFANLYDARIGGGFAVPNPPAHCSEESCQGPLQAAPSVEHPNSSSFFGEGNLKPRPRHPCAKKRDKAKRRCIRRHKRRSQRARAVRQR